MTRVGRAALVVLVACPGCSRDKSSTQELNKGDTQASCVVARGDGFVIDRSDAEDVRRRFAPPPTIEQASRLALDVWLAEWIATGEIEQLPLRERLRQHRRFAAGPLDERFAALAVARATLHVQFGPCWPALAADAQHAQPGPSRRE